MAGTLCSQSFARLRFDRLPRDRSLDSGIKCFGSDRDFSPPFFGDRDRFIGRNRRPQRLNQLQSVVNRKRCRFTQNRMQCRHPRVPPSRVLKGFWLKVSPAVWGDSMGSLALFSRNAVPPGTKTVFVDEKPTRFARIETGGSRDVNSFVHWVAHRPAFESFESSSCRRNRLKPHSPHSRRENP
jgi:hypothetical protein